MSNLEKLAQEKEKFLNIVRLETDTFKYVIDNLQKILQGQEPETGGGEENVLLNKGYAMFAKGKYKKAHRIWEETRDEYGNVEALACHCIKTWLFKKKDIGEQLNSLSEIYNKLLPETIDNFFSGLLNRNTIKSLRSLAASTNIIVD